MRLIRRVPLTTRLLLCGLICLSLTTGLTVILNAKLLRSSAEREVLHRVESNMQVAWRLLHQLGAEISVSDGRLRAGSTVLNNNLAFVDDVQNMVGGVVSVFQGDRRVATNVLQKDGTRATGTHLASEAVRRAVLVEHQPFEGVVDVLGRHYYSRYEPIFDAAGEQVGILYVGIEESGVLHDINRTRNIIVSVSLGGILLVGGILSWLGSKLAAQLAQRQHLLETARSQLDTALDNMGRGLGLWDASERLVLANRRLSEILDLPPERIRHGMSFDEFQGLRHEAGHYGDKPLRQVLGESGRRAKASRSGIFLDVAEDGRAIQLEVQPVGDGGWVTVYEDQTERRRAETQVRFMAKHDGLTGLANRTHFGERLHELIEQGAPFSLISVDLDRFKDVNDKHGHPVGDALLQEVADRLRASVRDTDLVARLGGDEFAIIRMGGTDLGDAADVASRVVEALCRPFEIDGHALSIGASGGVAHAGAGANAELLLSQADIALYRAKNEGRAGFRCFDASMEADLLQRRRLEADLRQAFANDELDVFYQPLVDVRAAKVSCFEALVRWRHPVRGYVPPAEFIPLAEEIGLIDEIGAWVLQRACLDAVTWPEDVKVAVNLSALQFRGGKLLPSVNAALSASGLRPQRLELEITESVLLQVTTDVSRLLQALREIGVRVAMDDFGTGCCSLSYLRSFSFDKIKIDQSFVRDAPGNAGSRAVLRAVVSLAASLRMETVAEGVETVHQLEQVCAEGCGEVQGYLFSRPRPSAEVGDMFRSVADFMRDRAKANAVQALREADQGWVPGSVPASTEARTAEQVFAEVD